jgi:hypothetical protein
MMDLSDFNDSGSLADASSLKYGESSRRPSKYDVNPFEVNRLDNKFNQSTIIIKEKNDYANKSNKSNKVYEHIKKDLELRAKRNVGRTDKGQQVG